MCQWNCLLALKLSTSLSGEQIEFSYFTKSAFIVCFLGLRFIITSMIIIIINFINCIITDIIITIITVVIATIVINIDIVFFFQRRSLVRSMHHYNASQMHPFVFISECFPIPSTCYILCKIQVPVANHCKFPLELVATNTAMASDRHWECETEPTFTFVLKVFVFGSVKWKFNF